MINANGNFQLIKQNYLFYTVGQKTNEYLEKHPEADIIRLGIGDVTRPLVPAVTEALHAAVDDMARAETFEGYPPNAGYDFLKQAILDNDYTARGIRLDIDEIFVSDGAKSDTANFTDMFGSGNIIAITDPVYPVYFDSNVMAGKAGKAGVNGEFSKIRLMPCVAENGFAPDIPSRRVDIIYLCSPNNPTGTALNFSQLKAWVDYAIKHGSLILFDGAYEGFVREPGIPRSIYEIEGARSCAVEFRSFSKTGGFTGVRCAYTVVPKELKGRVRDGGLVSLHKMWTRRHSTKFNGVSYIIQKAALAVYSPEGKKQLKENMDYYLANARAIRECFAGLGYRAYGGTNSPYVWLKTPEGYDSWSFFDHLLADYNIVGTPGEGFGACGEGYFRLTGFGTKERTKEAIERLKR